MSAPKETENFPAWYDPAVHSPGGGGIIETATNTLLGEDGQPLSAAVALARAALEPAPAAKTRKPRGTGEIVADTTRELATSVAAAATEPKE